MVSEKLLERLRDYLNEKYRNETKFKPFFIEIRPSYLPDRKWEINTDWSSGVGVYESLDGKIVVHSHRVGDYEDAVEIISLEYVYGPKLKKAKN